MKTPVKWFRRAVWLGIIGNWVLTLPLIFAPEWTLDLLGLRATHDPVWTAFAALLVFLVTIFYIPGATQPYRYRFNAWLAVLARPLEVLFFLVLYPGLYSGFVFYDGVLFLIQLPLLMLTMRRRPAEEPLEKTLQAPPTDRNALWLKRTLWAGILANLVLAIPTIFWPEQVLDLIGARQTLDPVWSAFAALMLVLLSIFYMPGANQPYRYRFNAVMAVLSRLVGVLFFLWLWAGFYPAFGYLDAVFFLAQVPFLVMAHWPKPRAA